MTDGERQRIVNLLVDSIIMLADDSDKTWSEKRDQILRRFGADYNNKLEEFLAWFEDEEA